MLCDRAMLVKGIGSLSLSSVAVVVPLRAGDAMPVPSLLCDGSLGSDEEDDGDELAPR
jgi:hypothetical protein